MLSYISIKIIKQCLDSPNTVLGQNSFATNNRLSLILVYDYTTLIYLNATILP